MKMGPGCTMHRLCTLAEACANTVGKLDPVILAHRKVPKRAALYRSGEPFKSLFSVRSGFFKTVVATPDGREQVTGFHMSGDLIGLDGIGQRHHACTAVALENSEVCVFPYDDVTALAREAPDLHSCLHDIMSDELAREQRAMLVLGRMPADERVASFLVDLLDRLATRGWSSSETILRMTRNDIGVYLGLSLETVSRVFSLMAAARILRVRSRNLSILDRARLDRVASGDLSVARSNAAPARAAGGR